MYSSRKVKMPAKLFTFSGQLLNSSAWPSACPRHGRAGGLLKRHRDSPGLVVADVGANLIFTSVAIDCAPGAKHGKLWR